MPTKVEEYLHDAEVPIEFEDEREEILVRQAVQGKDVQDWLLSPVGRWVCGAGAMDQRDIESQLVTIKPNTPWRRRKITELQQQYEAINLAIGWLSEAVKIGAAAERELHEVSE